ncbi:MAG: sigma-70 family RNA polymerase sigma factor [Acidimicrobiia bacterium]
MKDAPVTVGRAAELESVYREHGPRLWRAVLAYSGDPEIASDAVAEAFAQAMASRSTIRSPVRWVWRTAFRVAAGSLKGRSSMVELDEEVPFETSEPAWELLQALSQLSPKQRASVVLHHFAGYSVAEIAQIIGAAPPTVKVHLNRGRNRLRRLLAEGGTDG